MQKTQQRPTISNISSIYRCNEKQEQKQQQTGGYKTRKTTRQQMEKISANSNNVGATKHL